MNTTPDEIDVNEEAAYRATMLDFYRGLETLYPDPEARRHWIEQNRNELGSQTDNTLAERAENIRVLLEAKSADEFADRMLVLHRAKNQERKANGQPLPTAQEYNNLDGILRAIISLLTGGAGFAVPPAPEAVAARIESQRPETANVGQYSVKTSEFVVDFGPNAAHVDGPPPHTRVNLPNGKVLDIDEYNRHGGFMGVERASDGSYTIQWTSGSLQHKAEHIPRSSISPALAAYFDRSIAAKKSPNGEPPSQPEGITAPGILPAEEMARRAGPGGVAVAAWSFPPDTLLRYQTGDYLVVDELAGEGSQLGFSRSSDGQSYTMSYQDDLKRVQTTTVKREDLPPNVARLIDSQIDARGPVLGAAPAAPIVKPLV